jgi:hypothetical protein
MASPVGTVKDFIVEYRKIKSKAELDGVCGRKLGGLMA